MLAGCASTHPHPSTTRQYADESFQKLRQDEALQKKGREQPSRSLPDLAHRSTTLPAVTKDSQQHASSYPDGQYLVATGYGDLTKGHLTCQRVSETVARMELAKQIRVLVKEHAIDRIRERTGELFEQDIEIVREEITQELLRDVKIVDRAIDEAAGTCSSTIMMPSSHITPAPVTTLEMSRPQQ